MKNHLNRENIRLKTSFYLLFTQFHGDDEYAMY